MNLKDPTSGDMMPATFWRTRHRVAASVSPADETYLEQAGYTRIEPNQTYPASRYYLPGDYEHAVDPRTWEHVTGLRAARRTEYCPTCGKHIPTECDGKYHRKDKKTLTHVWTAKSRARYYACGTDAVGSAHTAEHELAYLRADWRPIRRPEACQLSQTARCTIGGPERTVLAADAKAVWQYQNKKWHTIIRIDDLTHPPA